VVPEENVIILDRRVEHYTTMELYGKVKASDDGVTGTNTGFRCLNGQLDYDQESGEMKLLQINIAEDAKSTVNQYEVLVNLLFSREEKDMGYRVPGLSLIKEGGLYMYLPMARPVDLEKEVRNYYDRYVSEVLVKA
jgi:hypothetical protein